MVELPIVNPVVINGLRFVDLRNFQDNARHVATKFVARMQRAIVEELDLIPRTILCECSDVRRADRELRGDRKQRMEEQKRFRHTVEFFQGEREPITFLVQRNQQPWGAWQWYGIRILQDSDRMIRIRAGCFPAFPFPITKRQLVKRTTDVSVGFLNTQLDLDDGRKLQVFEVASQTFNDAHEDTRIVKLAHEYIATQDVDFERVTDSRQLGRELTVMRKR